MERWPWFLLYCMLQLILNYACSQTLFRIGLITRSLRNISPDISTVF